MSIAFSSSDVIVVTPVKMAGIVPVAAIVLVARVGSVCVIGVCTVVVLATVVCVVVIAWVSSVTSVVDRVVIASEVVQAVRTSIKEITTKRTGDRAILIEYPLISDVIYKYFILYHNVKKGGRILPLPPPYSFYP
jgi:hypothetical protein